VGSESEQGPKEETLTAAQCGSQKSVGWEPLKGICYQLVLFDQPSSSLCGSDSME